MEFSLEPYVPRKGNKFGIVNQIWDTIQALDIPKPLGFVDAFTGGGSFAYFAARRGYPVIANDIEKGLIDLHNMLAIAPQDLFVWKKHFFTKEQFMALRDREDAYGEYVRSLWSFSNDGRTYLTSFEKEQAKIEEFKRGDAEPNSRFKHLEDITLLHSRYDLDVRFVCGSYDKLEIPEGWVVYCDPPYRGTAGYRSGTFDYKKFDDWCRKQPGLVLISEYNMPEDFTLVAEYSKWQESARGARTKKVIEKVFANKPVKPLSLF